MRAHLDTALVAGVDEDTLRALLLLMGELGMGKVWQALTALDVHVHARKNGNVSVTA
jgi:hypothetical protein